MDRVTSNILGRPLAIRDEDIDALLPCEEEGFESISALTDTATRIPRTAVFRRIIEYRLLCGNVLTTLHRRRAPTMTTTDALQMRADLAKKLETWQERLAQLNLSDDTTSDTSERSCFLSPVWYRVLYANAKLSIWRPCPLLADLSHDQHSLQNIYHCLLRTPQVSQDQLQLDRPAINLHGRPVLPVQRKQAFPRTAQPPLCVNRMLPASRRSQSYRHLSNLKSVFQCHGRCSREMECPTALSRSLRSAERCRPS